MCQLTLIHGRSDLARVLLPNLTLSNSVDNNKDGHGYFVIPTMIWRTIDPGNRIVFEDEYHDSLREYIGDQKQVAIISHVRSASYKFKDMLDVEHTHPFQCDNLVLMHNGTLVPKDKKLEIDNTIDSYWFTKHLASVVGEEMLTPEHIAEAMEDFIGKFALFIVDMKQPEKIFIAKGRIATLYETTIVDGRNKILARVINTSKQNLQYSSLPMYWRAFKSTSLKINEPEELDDESIYIYDIKKSELIKSDVAIEEETSTAVTVIHDGRFMGQGAYSDYDQWSGANNYGAPKTLDSMIDKISDMAFKMKLKFTDVNLLFGIVCGSSIMFADKMDVEIFHKFMNLLMDEYDNRVGKKLPNWTIIQQAFYNEFPHGTGLEIYEKTNLNFPWFLQSGSRIKNVSTRIKAGSFNWETTG